MGMSRRWRGNAGAAAPASGAGAKSLTTNRCTITINRCPISDSASGSERLTMNGDEPSLAGECGGGSPRKWCWCEEPDDESLHNNHQQMSHQRFGVGL